MSFSDMEVHGAEAVIRAAMLEAEGGKSIAIIARDGDHMRHLAEAVEAFAPEWFEPQVSMAKRRIDFISGAQVHLMHLGDSERRLVGPTFGFALWWGPAVGPGWHNLTFAMRRGSRRILQIAPETFESAKEWRLGL